MTFVYMAVITIVCGVIINAIVNSAEKKKK